MAVPRKYPDELRERANRMAVEARRDPATRPGALARIDDRLGINHETLRNRGTQAGQAQRITELEREVRELRRANAILRSASAFFASVLPWSVLRIEVPL